jgi:hypothetical protein
MTMSRCLIETTDPNNPELAAFVEELREIDMAMGGKGDIAVVNRDCLSSYTPAELARSEQVLTKTLARLRGV